MHRSGVRALSACLLCLVLAACSAIEPLRPTATPTAGGTASAAAPSQPPATGKATQAAATPASPSPSPSPSPTPDPTPSPSPTATPDPWAGFFSADGSWISVPDWDNGPWVYRDQTLSIRVERRKLGKIPYFCAEIYTRGPLPFGGFAYNDTAKARKRALPYLVARQNDAIFGITGDQIVIGENPKGVMIRQGKVYKDAKNAPVMAVMPDGELKVYDPGKITAKELQGMGVKDAFAFGPILVRDGKIDPGVYTVKRNGGHNWRAAFGMVEKNHYIAVVNPVGVYLEQLAQIFVDNRCTVAFNLDGGHSSTIVFMGEQLYKQAPGDDNGEQRTLSDMLLIGTSPAVPKPDAPVYCNGLGYNKANKPKPTEGPLH